MGQTPVVVYKDGLVGDQLNGLGNSQKGEVAWLEKEGIAYVNWDIKEFVQHAPVLARAQQAPDLSNLQTRSADDLEFSMAAVSEWVGMPPPQQDEEEAPKGSDDEAYADDFEEEEEGAEEAPAAALGTVDSESVRDSDQAARKSPIAPNAKAKK